MVDIGSSAALYFYSAVFQGNMAILALAGVFVVYRLQVNSNQIEAIEQAIVTYVHKYLSAESGFINVPVVYDKVSAIPAYLRELASGPQEDPGDEVRTAAKNLCDDDKLKRMLSARERIVAFRTDIKSQIRRPFLVTLFVVVISLVMLPLATVIHETKPLLEIAFICITILANVAALWLTKRLVWFSLKLK